MPAENRNSDCSSLNWEDFFGSSNSEDLLPCLLSVYDSIAAARKLQDNVLEQSATAEDLATTISDLAVAEDHADNASSSVRVQHMDYDFVECPSSTLRSTSAHASSSEMSWCRARDVTSTPIRPNKSDSCFNIMRPNSAVSMTSISSRSSGSVCSNGSSGSESSISMDNEELNQQCIDDRNNLPRSEYLDSLVVDDSDRRKSTELHMPELRTSYTTASQYSEDSGIYSSLVRSESPQDRSCFCGDGEDFSYTNRVILEILETEFIYVNDLQQIITGYLDEWKNDFSCPLSTEQIHDLFGNIEEIYHFNRCFLWELEQCGLDSVKIARCFVKHNSNFSIYAAYCTHYPRSISILTELMRQERTAHIFRERQISLHHTLPLGSYLLKPVQRILKYHLLLQNMVKHTSPDMVGYNDITVALSTMTGIAHHINTMKRRHEHAVRVQEVQSLLTGWQGPDLTTFGELYAEGSFRISGAKAFRHIFLFEHMLLVTKKKEGGILNYKTHILCSNLMLVECIPKEPLSFQIIPFDNPRFQFSVHARSLEEKRHWTLELKRVILENYSVDIPSHARQLVMELGQTQHSGDVSLEKMSSQKRQHSTPEYLERRKLYREKKSSVKSRFMPLFRKLDTLQNHKMRSKLKKNQFLSENSIFSDSSANSDESCLHDTGLQSLSKTTEDLSQTCDKMTRTLEDLSKSSTNSSSSCSADNRVFGDGANDSVSSSEAEDRHSYQQKEKLIEEIIGQLLIASQKFQKAIKDHERSVRSKHAPHNLKSDESDDDETDDDVYSDAESSRMPTAVLKYTKQSDDVICSKEASRLNTSSESLSASLNILAPTPPNIWLKQQREHLATPQKKADSLPRTFQISTEDEWRSVRPKTIASDKPSRMNCNQLYETDENMAGSNCFLNRKKQLVSVTSVPSLHHAASLHPECKFYRTSVVRMTFHRMVRTIGTKLLVKRGRSERFYKVDQDAGCASSSKYAKCNPDVDGSKVKQCDPPIYRQGSSDLGARIANGKEVSDYADPKVLFPTITPSKKAASLLGIRAYSRASLTRNDDADSRSSPKNAAAAGERTSNGPSAEQQDRETASNCSADSFYERQFEEVESEFDSAIRETSILNDDIAELEEAEDVGQSFRKYSQVNVNISVHKLIKIPPPVPVRPTTLRPASCLQKRSALIGPKPKLNVNLSKESTIPTRGWVKQVVNRFQSGND